MGNDSWGAFLKVGGHAKLAIEEIKNPSYLFAITMHTILN